MKNRFCKLLKLFQNIKFLRNLGKSTRFLPFLISLKSHVKIKKKTFCKFHPKNHKTALKGFNHQPGKCVHPRIPGSSRGLFMLYSYLPCCPPPSTNHSIGSPWLIEQRPLKGGRGGWSRGVRTSNNGDHHQRNDFQIETNFLSHARAPRAPLCGSYNNCRTISSERFFLLLFVWRESKFACMTVPKVSDLTPNLTRPSLTSFGDEIYAMFLAWSDL